MPPDPTSSPREFSITSGGPFNRLATRLHLRGPHGLRVWRVAAIAWIPLAVAAVIGFALNGRIDPLLLDISVHERFLISLPLLVLSENLLEVQCRAAVEELDELVDRAVVDRIVTSTERLRDNSWVEYAIAALALTDGQLVLWRVFGPTGLFHGIQHVDWSFVRIWYAAFALPIVLFLALRWLWRWIVWSYLLVQLSRVPLATIATHPDRAAGLRVLSGPVTGFAAFELAFASLLASVWGTQLLDGRVTVPSLIPTFIVFLALSFLVGCGPLFLFTPQLYRAQRITLHAYFPLALDYVRRFHHKWIEQRTENPLGTSDLQSLADLRHSYQVIEETSLVVFGTRKLIELALAAIIPMLPLLLTVVPVEDVLRRIGSALFGGLI